MDAPFEKKEEFVELNKGLLERGSAAVRALRFYEQEVLHFDHKDKIASIDLAGNFLATRLEVDMHISDADSMASDEEQAKYIDQNKKLTDQERRRRGAIEIAIRNAQVGEYMDLKSVLRSEVERISKMSSSAVSEEDWRRLPGALTVLLDDIPDRSDHRFKLPQPSYLDPRFNPDASSLPFGKSTT